jgi:hypothetical protein
VVARLTRGLVGGLIHLWTGCLDSGTLFNFEVSSGWRGDDTLELLWARAYA